MNEFDQIAEDEQIVCLDTPPADPITTKRSVDNGNIPGTLVSVMLRSSICFSLNFFSVT